MAGLGQGLRRLLLAGLSGMPEDPTVSGMTSDGLGGGAEGGEELVAVLDGCGVQIFHSVTHFVVDYGR